MLGKIIFALGGATAMYLAQHRKPKVSVPLANVLALPPVPPHVAQVTPAVAAIHGELLANCIDPQKLARGAALFGHEGLPQHAQALLHKAQLLHEMMHGAKAIVERCRAGDQHAMALAKGIGEQAQAGNKRAQVSAFFIKEYSDKNPNPDVKKAA